MYFNGCRYSDICFAKDAIAKGDTLIKWKTKGYEKLLKHRKNVKGFS